jgi:FG-GAP repeat
MHRRMKGGALAAGPPVADVGRTPRATTATVFLLAAMLLTFATTAAPSLPRPASERQATGLSSLPPAAQATISGALGRDSHQYLARATESGFRSENPAHGLVAEFTKSGVVVKAGAGRLGLSLRRFGYGTSLQRVAPASPQATRNRVTYRRGALTEWYVNGPLGLEQGFTLAAAPTRRGSGPLTLSLSLSGTLHPSVAPGATGLTLARASRSSSLHYSGLAAVDANGRALPAWLVLEGSTLLVRVGDAGARYPLTIDPMFEQAKLTASDGAAADNLGISVAVSGDTVVVGAWLDDGGKGSAYVFVKPGGGWASGTETAKLTASDRASSDWFGSSVAVSGDTVVVGAPEDDVGANGNQGSAYVFVKPGGGWASGAETAKLTASDGAGSDELGWSVAVSGDTAVAGAIYDDVGANGDQGSAYVFVKPGGGWASGTETAKLTASDGAAEDRLFSVAASGDTVVAGAYLDDVGANGNQGSAYVFVKPGGGWATGAETAKLTSSDGSVSDFFGFSVAVSGDTVVAGAYRDNVGATVDQGSAYVFVKPGGGWASGTETAKLTASDGAANDWLGQAVAASGDTIVAGAYQDDVGANLDQGSAYVFVKPGGGWANGTETAKLTASDGAADDNLGYSVAVSGDTVVAGAIEDDVGANTDQGSAYVFLVPLPAPQVSAVAEGTEVAVFGRNPINELWYRETTNGTFGAWTKLSTSTNVASRPKAVMVGSDLYVFFRTTGNEIRYFLRHLGTWGSEQNLGGILAGSPTAAVDGDGDLIVAARNGSGVVFFDRLPSGGAWTGWSSLDGILSGQLELASYGGDVHLFGVNPAGLFWDKLWSRIPNSWGAWTALDGVLQSSPAATVFSSDLYVFGTNPAGILFYRALSGGVWGAWTALDGVLSGSPDAAATATTLLAFGTNPAGSLWDRRSTGVFGAWDPLDGVLTTGPEAVAVGADTYVFGLNPDGNLWYRLWNGASFGAWTNLDGVLGTE